MLEDITIDLSDCSFRFEAIFNYLRERRMLIQIILNPFLSLRSISLQPILNCSVIGFHPSYVGFRLLYRLLHRSCGTSELPYVLFGEFH